MKKRTKIIIGVTGALAVCVIVAVVLLTAKNGGLKELLEKTPLADIVDGLSDDEDEFAADAGGTGGEDGADGDNGGAGATQTNGYVDSGGAQVSGKIGRAHV